jgi:hypothetical protein
MVVVLGIGAMGLFGGSAIWPYLRFQTAYTVPMTFIIAGIAITGGVLVFTRAAASRVLSVSPFIDDIHPQRHHRHIRGSDARQVGGTGGGGTPENKRNSGGITPRSIGGVDELINSSVPPSPNMLPMVAEIGTTNLNTTVDDGMNAINNTPTTNHTTTGSKDLTPPRTPPRTPYLTVHGFTSLRSSVARAAIGTWTSSSPPHSVSGSPKANPHHRTLTMSSYSPSVGLLSAGDNGPSSTRNTDTGDTKLIMNTNSNMDNNNSGPPSPMMVAQNSEGIFPSPNNRLLSTSPLYLPSSVSPSLAVPSVSSSSMLGPVTPSPTPPPPLPHQIPTSFDMDSPSNNNINITNNSPDGRNHDTGIAMGIMISPPDAS